MAIEYPDMMGDYTDARQRFDAGGLHYICSLEPDTIAPGGRIEILFLVQSALDVPLEAEVRVELPTRAGRLGRAVRFDAAQPELRVNVATGEVGLLHIPLTCGADTPTGKYEVRVNIVATPSGHAQLIRPTRTPGRFGKSLIRDPVGLGIASVIGLGYTAEPKTRQSLHLEVIGDAEAQEVDLSPGFDTLWTPDQLTHQHAAQREVLDRRLHILAKLSPDALYAALWQESLSLFKDAGVPLRMGEAIFVARILTYTANEFLNHADWYDALLVPIWVTAIRNNLSTSNMLSVATQVGYGHLLRLSAAMSFGLIDRAMGREVWSNEEQRAVVDLLSDTVVKGQGTLPAEFLYLPLILGGLAISRDLKMPEEDLHHSLQLLTQAHRDRAAIFDEELALVNDLFEQLVLEARR
ncbi:MAG: hypothetical protein JSV36_10685 [Anaerolineae bacterium]|nr:MAG: hypothetical protein JSV36_10685 [Anaerolineae bacterium]